MKPESCDHAPYPPPGFRIARRGARDKNDVDAISWA